MGFRSDFYNQLSEEVYNFSLDRDGINNLPFLAKQMEDLKTFAPGSAYSIIKKLDRQFHNREIQEKEYFCSLLETALRKRIRIQERIFITAEECRSMFPSPSYDPRDQELFAGSDSNKRKHLYYKRTQYILDSMRSAPDEPLPGCDKALASLSRLLLAEALVSEAKAWLYDSGFPSKQGKNVTPRKIDRSFQLIDRYFEEKERAEQSAFSNSAKNNASLKDDAKNLFSLMCKNPDYSTAIIPITVDSSSGTGLYIYGIESDDENGAYAFGNNKILQRLVKSENYTCYYTIFEYRYSERLEDEEYPETGPARLTYLQHVINEDSEDECVGYPNIDDAWHDYIQAVNSKKDSYISYENASAPPGCPLYFRQFFSDYDPEQQAYEINDLNIDFDTPVEAHAFDSEVKTQRNEADAGSISSFNL